jgi:hypothetical protein
VACPHFDIFEAAKLNTRGKPILHSCAFLNIEKFVNEEW